MGFHLAAGKAIKLMAPTASENGFDAGVRLAEAVPRDLIAMPLGPHPRHVVVGAPNYFANKRRPT